MNSLAYLIHSVSEKYKLSYIMKLPWYILSGTYTLAYSSTSSVTKEKRIRSPPGPDVSKLLTTVIY